MLKIQQDVLEFHKKFNILNNNTPQIIDYREECLRRRLHMEEYNELSAAIADKNLVEIADGIADLIYVVIGTAIAYGIDLESIWDEVHKTNMAKVGGGVRDNGKILKPEGWKPPEIDRLLLQQQSTTKTIADIAPVPDGPVDRWDKTFLSEGYTKQPNHDDNCDCSDCRIDPSYPHKLNPNG